jgi:hypothetical protein
MDDKVRAKFVDQAPGTKPSPQGGETLQGLITQRNDWQIEAWCQKPLIGFSAFETAQYDFDLMLQLEQSLGK